VEDEANTKVKEESD